jgi:hypothetical protein
VLFLFDGLWNQLPNTDRTEAIGFRNAAINMKGADMHIAHTTAKIN